jgi:hypothetical protein
MRRLLSTLPSLTALVLASATFAGSTLAINSRQTLQQAMAAGWDCTPLILIGGHYHCSPPGKQGVAEIIAGTADSPSIVHTVFRADGTFAGTETLIRADLFAGQPCPTDVWLPVPPWLPEPTYWACHHFAFSTLATP